MHDSTARQIRDILVVILWVQLAILAVGILLFGIAGYWHFKVDAARRRVLAPDPVPAAALDSRRAAGPWE
jgi:hypothetical protein